jgi:hypothetical protein
MPKLGLLIFLIVFIYDTRKGDFGLLSVMDWKFIKRPLKLILGWIMLIGGIITAPLPLPIGQFIALIGLSLLISESIWVKIKMQKMRRRMPIIGRQLTRMHPYLPKFLKKVVDDTDPAHLAE